MIRRRSESPPPVRLPSGNGFPLLAPINVTESAIVAETSPAQEGVLFDDDRGLPPEVQKFIASLFVSPHGTHALQELRAALKTFKEMSEVSRSFNRFAIPLRHATFLRLFGLGRIENASFDHLLRHDLPKILEGIVARSGLSGLQCLSDLVNGSLGEHPDPSTKAFEHWIHLAQTATTTAALPYHAVPTLIAMRLGQMLSRGSGFSSLSVLMLAKQLVRLAGQGSLPLDLAKPALIEIVLVVQARELAFGRTFFALPPSDTVLQPVAFGSRAVWGAMQTLGQLSAGLQDSLLAVAKVLATTRQKYVGGEPLTQARVLTALNYLADCPYPLIGCLAEALDIIQRMDLGQDPHVESLLARCAAKLASVRLLGPSLQ